MKYSQRDLKLKIKSKIEDYVLEKEGINHTLLGPIAIILNTSSKRKNIVSKTMEELEDFVDKFVELEFLKNWCDFFNKLDFETLQNEMFEAINSVKNKPDPNNQSIELIKFLNKIKPVELSKISETNNKVKILENICLIWIAEQSNRQNLVRHDEIFSFRGLLYNFSVPANIIKINQSIEHLIDDYRNDFQKNNFNKKIHEAILRLNSMINNRDDFENFKKLNCDWYEISNIIREVTSDYFIERKVCEEIDQLMMDGFLEKQSLIIMGKSLIKRHHYFSRAENILSMTRDEKKENIKNKINTMIGNPKTVEDLRTLFLTNEDFLLLSLTINSHNLKKMFIETLTVEETNYLLSIDTPLNYLYQEKKIYENLIEKKKSEAIIKKAERDFLSGNDDLGWKEKPSKTFILDFNKVKNVLANSIGDRKAKETSSEFYSLVLDKKTNELNITLFGEYTQMLDKESSLEIMLAIIKEIHGIKEGNVASLVHSYELKENLKDVKSNLTDSSQRKKV